MRVRALYNDGHAAVSHRVTVAVDAAGLAIMNSEDQRISMWPAAGLELVERPIGRSPFRAGTWRRVSSVRKLPWSSTGR